MPQRLDHLALQEIKALQEVKRAGVSRVANLLDHFKGPDGVNYLVLEYGHDCRSTCCHVVTRRCNLDFCCRLVVGFNLYQYSTWRNKKAFDLNVESKMKTVAVQLIEVSSLCCRLVPWQLLSCYSYIVAVNCLRFIACVAGWCCDPSFLSQMTFAVSCLNCLA